MEISQDKCIINPETLAQLFLRLNGFFLLSNFIIHRENEFEYRPGTDIDICGVRFPNRKEILYRPVRDDNRLTSLNLPILVLGEVKTSNCSINKSWLKENSDILQRLIATTGIFRENEIDNIVVKLKETGRFVNDKFVVQITCFGENPVDCFYVDETKINLSEVIQITWEYILEFVFNRFKEYSLEKKYHPQWEQIGQTIWKLVYNSIDYNEFRQQVIVGENNSYIVRKYLNELSISQTNNDNKSLNQISYELELLNKYLERLKSMPNRPTKLNKFHRDFEYQMKFSLTKEMLMELLSKTSKIEITKNEKLIYKLE